MRDPTPTGRCPLCRVLVAAATGLSLIAATGCWRNDSRIPTKPRPNVTSVQADPTPSLDSSAVANQAYPNTDPATPNPFAEPPTGSAVAQDPQEPDDGPPTFDFDALDKPMEPPEEAKGLLRVNPNFDLWLDAKNKKLVLGGRVVFRKGQLELFACKFRTKEHESIVTVRTRAEDVHALLVALGAQPGKPVQFRNQKNEEEYRAAHGPEIDVRVHWTDKEGKRRSARAQDWVRNVRTGKAMDVPWVFGGSYFFVDNEGKKHYVGEDGDLLCVSNFTSAVMDLPIQSSADATGLLFEPYTERIPPRGTVVALVLTPELPVEAPDPPK